MWCNANVNAVQTLAAPRRVSHITHEQVHFQILQYTWTTCKGTIWLFQLGVPKDPMQAIQLQLQAVFSGWANKIPQIDELVAAIRARENYIDVD